MQLRCLLSLYKPQLCYSPLAPSFSYRHRGAVGVKLVKLHPAASRVEKHPSHRSGPQHGTNAISPAPGHSTEPVRSFKLYELSPVAALLAEQLTDSWVTPANVAHKGPVALQGREHFSSGGA